MRHGAKIVSIFKTSRFINYIFIILPVMFLSISNMPMVLEEAKHLSTAEPGLKNSMLSFV
jgi:hypothetical protein